MDRLFLCLCLVSLMACGGAEESSEPPLQDALSSDAAVDASSQALDADPEIELGDADVSMTLDVEDGQEALSIPDAPLDGPIEVSEGDGSDGQETQDGVGDALEDSLDVFIEDTPEEVETAPDVEEVFDTSVVQDSASQDTPDPLDMGSDGSEDTGKPDTADEILEDTAPVDPCLGASCDDGDPCTQNSCVDGACLFEIVPAYEGAACGPSHACAQGQCVPGCAILIEQVHDLTESPGGLISENCAWTLGSGWSCSGAGDAGSLTSTELEDLSMFRVDVTAELEGAGVLALTWPVDDGSQWRTVHLSATELSVTTGTEPLSSEIVSSGPFPLALNEELHTLSLLRLVDHSFRVLVDGVTVVKTGVLPSAPTALDLTLSPSFISVTLVALTVSPVFSTCDDGNPCTSDQCDWESGECQGESLDGAPCPDDGLACTVETCAAGDCEHTTAEQACLIDGLCYGPGDTDSTNPCAVCSPQAAQASFSAVDPSSPVECDDQDPCTEQDLCQAMLCVGTPMNCDDLSSCTLDVCVAGDCEHLAGEDGLLCDASSLCAQGVCTEACMGPPELETGFDEGPGLWTELAGVWSASNGALVQSGGGAGGVSHPALSGVQAFDLAFLTAITKDDPVVGTQGAVRVDLYDGALTADELPRYRVQLQTNHPIFGGSITLSFAGPGFLIQVDQALIDLEVGQEIVLGVRLTPDGRLEATVDGELMVDLTDFGDLAESLTLALGFDQHGAIDDVVFISSGQFCDDGLGCTDDLCLADGSCESTLVSQSCLVEGLCYEAGELAPENPCAVCDPSLSGVLWSPSATADSPVLCALDDPCEENGNCALNATLCLGEPVDCDDEDPCTIDTCVDGSCQSTDVVCDDADLCTVDACVQGLCSFEPLDCEDGDPCTSDLCTDGACSSEPVQGCGQSDASDASDASDGEDTSDGEDDPGPSEDP